MSLSTSFLGSNYLHRWWVSPVCQTKRFVRFRTIKDDIFCCRQDPVFSRLNCWCQLKRCPHLGCWLRKLWRLLRRLSTDSGTTLVWCFRYHTFKLFARIQAMGIFDFPRKRLIGCLGMFAHPTLEIWSVPKYRCFQIQEALIICNVPSMVELSRQFQKKPQCCWFVDC